jgi:hypothetical protein
MNRLLLFFVFLNALFCVNPKRDVTVKMLSEVAISDTVFSHKEVFVLNEYYPFKVENNLYDTILVALNIFNGSKVASMQSSRIDYFVKGEYNGMSLSNNGMPTSILSIARGESKVVFFSLPEYSKNLITKEYNFYLTESNTKSLIDFKIRSGTNALQKIIVK